MTINEGTPDLVMAMEIIMGANDSSLGFGYMVKSD